MKEMTKRCAWPFSSDALLLLYGRTALTQNMPRTTHSEPYRTQFHFSSENGWVGDPSDSFTTRGSTSIAQKLRIMQSLLFSSMVSHPT